MYSFFDLAGTTGARAAAAAGSLIITLVVMAIYLAPTSPVTSLTIGAIA